MSIPKDCQGQSQTFGHLDRVVRLKCHTLLHIEPLSKLLVGRIGLHLSRLGLLELPNTSAKVANHGKAAIGVDHMGQSRADLGNLALKLGLERLEVRGKCLNSSSHVCYVLLLLRLLKGRIIFLS